MLDYLYFPQLLSPIYMMLFVIQDIIYHYDPTSGQYGLETAAEPDKTWSHVMSRLMRGKYGNRGRRLEDKTKHFRKLNEDQVDGKMVADTYRTTEIE